jgi:hypothetical protein
MVADAVTVEPVSAGFFTGNSEKNSVTREKGPKSKKSAAVLVVISDV